VVHRPVGAQQHLIGGDRVDGDGDALDVVDPATEETIATINQVSPQQLDAAVDAARFASDRSDWARSTPSERSALLAAIADAVAANREELVSTLVAESGCPITACRLHQVGGTIGYLRWYSDAALRPRESALGPRSGATASAAVVRYLPVGVVGAITASNYPLLLAVNKLGAALAAGCSVVLMPNPETPLATMAFGRIMREAGLPPGAVNVIAGDAATAKRLTEHRLVDKVSFTGSTAVGSAIARQAASVSKGVVLELGGKAPCILLPDADLKSITGSLLLRLFRHSGQGCQVPSRLLVQRDRLDEFVALARKATSTVAVGDPWDEKTEVGPIISSAQRDRVDAIVREAVTAGGEIICEGSLPGYDRGYWVAPALVGSVANAERISREEIFGPVGVVLPYGDVDEAVEIANDTDYGLAAHVFGPDTSRCLEVASRIRAGSVFCNGVGLRPDAPSGGMKDSGIGREQGEEGIRELMVTQTLAWKL
jgi:aldehyde dehydrogenase (NAD+)